MSKKHSVLVLASVFCLTSTVFGEVAPIRFKNGPLSLERKTPAVVQADLAAVASQSNVSRVILQFEQPVTADVRTKLNAAGITLLDFLGSNGFFARVDGRFFNAAALAAIPSLTRVGEIQVVHKLHPDLLFDRVHDWMIVGRDGASDGESDKVETNPATLDVAVYVKFHKDVSLEHNGVRVALEYGASVKSLITPINSLVIVLPYGQIKALANHPDVEWIEPPLPRYSELNEQNRARVGADIVQAAPYGLNGSGVTALVYDGGRVRTTHVDFQGRAIIGSDEWACTAVSDHSTHVAGTIAGAGVADATEKGMAPAANIVSYGFNEGPDDCSLGAAGWLYTNPGDMVHDYNTAINTHGADIANNSIGTNTAPNGFDCTWEGQYGLCSSTIDAIVRGSLGAPFRIVWANGNERQVTRCGTTYNTTAPPSCAKNHITVGALNANDDSVTSFTSWGPTEDGRMKPDISAPGCETGGDAGVRSCSSSSDTAYAVKCGTSMASPTVCGISALLLQDFRVQYPTRPDFRNSTLKILLAHTAVDLFNPGPDNQTGYGSVRIQPAVDFMRSGNFLENNVDQGGSYNVLVLVNPGDPVMKVTLAWDDPESLGVTIGTLVNDLDLVVFDPNNNQRFPWTLDIANPGNPALQTQKNSLDNIEQVVVNSPIPGAYRVEVRGLNVPQGPQPFSLCASPTLVNCSRQGVMILDRAVYPCSSTATITVIDCDLNTDDQVVETVNVSIASTSEPGGETVTLTETGPQTALFRGTIALNTTNSAGVLQVAHGDTITATYIDADDGQGGINVPVTTNSVVDCVAPAISNIQVTNVGIDTASVSFSTDEPAKGTIRYGTSCGALTQTIAESAFNTNHSFVLNGLIDGTTYFFAVDAVDAGTNSSTDDNGGACHTFATTPLPVLTLPFFEPFDITSFDVNKWFLVESATIDGLGIAEPSEPNSARFNGTPDGGDEIRTHRFDLSGETSVRMSYFYQIRGGGESPDSGDDLFVEFYNNAGSWQIINQHLGSGADMTTYQQVSVVLPASAYHAGFRVRFRNTATTGAFDDWFVDDIRLFVPNSPEAQNTSATTSANTAVPITLPASDPNGDTMTWIIMSLPTNGLLKDPNGGIINSVPYSLLSNGNAVLYKPAFNYQGTDQFTFKATDGTYDSNVANVDVTIGGPQPIHSFPLDSEPGWATDAGGGGGGPNGGGWAFGTPTNSDPPCGTGRLDPASGFTGANVYGYNLAGCYTNSLTPTRWLTTRSLNCTGATGIQLRFRRWLGVESASFDHAYVDVSTNGSTWTNIWSHTATSAINEQAWTLQTYNVPAADNQPTVYFRWGIGVTDASVIYQAWNIDDIEILGLVPQSCPPVTPGDVNGDSAVNSMDIKEFIKVLTDPFLATQSEQCAADVNSDNAVDLIDASALASLLVSEP